MKSLMSIVGDGFMQLHHKVRAYAVAVGSGDIDLQKIARESAEASFASMLDEVRTEVSKMHSAPEAGSNSQEKVGETVSAVINGPNGKSTIRRH